MDKHDVITALEPKRRKAVALFAQGYGYKRTARELEIAPYTARDWLRQYKQGRFLLEIPECIKGYSQEQKQKVRVLYAEGYSYHKIASICGISVSTCRRWIEQTLADG